MADTPQEQRKRYPLAAYNFRVTVDGVQMRFAKVSGLAREHKFVTYRHGLSYLQGEDVRSYYLQTYAPITLEQGVVAESATLSAWLQGFVTKPSSMEISLCDEQGAPIVAWSVAKAVPVKLSAPTFDAATNQVAVDTIEVQVTGVSIKRLG